MGRKIERLVALKLAGEQPDASLTAWLETVPSELREKLLGAGILSSVRVAAGKPLESHLEDYKSELVASGCCEKHVQVAHSRAKAVVDGCGMKLWQDVTPDSVREWLSNERKKGEMSGRTHNYYLRDIKSFCRWMVRRNRARENPLLCL